MVVVARIRPKLPKEDKEPDGGELRELGLKMLFLILSVLDTWDRPGHFNLLEFTWYRRVERKSWTSVEVTYL